MSLTRSVARALPLVAATLVAGAVAVLQPSSALAAKPCNIRGSEQAMGPSYVTSLKVTRTNCATGKKLVKAYYRCRVRNGGVTGKCRSKVMGYSCRETRSGISVQFNATVTCRAGSRTVVHTYTQNT